MNNINNYEIKPPPLPPLSDHNNSNRNISNSTSNNTNTNNNNNATNQYLNFQQQQSQNASTSPKLTKLHMAMNAATSSMLPLPHPPSPLPAQRPLTPPRSPTIIQRVTNTANSIASTTPTIVKQVNRYPQVNSAYHSKSASPAANVNMHDQQQHGAKSPKTGTSPTHHSHSSPAASSSSSHNNSLKINHLFSKSNNAANPNNTFIHSNRYNELVYNTASSGNSNNSSISTNRYANLKAIITNNPPSIVNLSKAARLNVANLLLFNGGNGGGISSSHFTSMWQNKRQGFAKRREISRSHEVRINTFIFYIFCLVFFYSLYF